MLMIMGGEWRARAHRRAVLGDMTPRDTYEDDRTRSWETDDDAGDSALDDGPDDLVSDEPRPPAD
jgi:hypothetical protein